MRLTIVAFMCFVLHSALGQHIDQPEVLSSLDEKEKVEYINEHFYAIYSEDYNRAKTLTQWAATTAHANHWKQEQAFALMNHGVVTYLKGEYDAGRASVRAEMSNYYQKIGHVNKKYVLLDTAEAIALKINDLGILAKTYGMRATYLKRDGRIEEAREYYNKNFDIYLESKDSVGLGYAYLDQAFFAQRDGDLNKAIDLINQSTIIRTRIRDQQGLAENLDYLGSTYWRAKKYHEAINEYEKCVDFAKTVDYPDQVRKAYQRLMELYKATGQHKQALIYQDSAYWLKDSLFNLKRTKTIEELQTKYETEKKEQQLAVQDAELAEQKALLLRNNLVIVGLVLLAIFIVLLAVLYRSRMRKKQQLEWQQKELDFTEAQLNAVIQSQEKERRRFATDLHDGFGQLISVLKMNVDAIKSNDVSLEKRAELFDKSTELLNGMYDELRGICFNLMPHTLVQEGLVAALRELVSRINLAEKITVEVLVYEFDERLVDLKEVSMYRIIQEWMNNIIKYSDATEVTIQLTKDASELTLTIEDNGMGFDKHLLIEGNGNGWKNINSRANLIQAELDIDTSLGIRGSMFTLNLPLSAQSSADIPSSADTELLSK